VNWQEGCRFWKRAIPSTGTGGNQLSTHIPCLGRPAWSAGWVLCVGQLSDRPPPASHSFHLGRHPLDQSTASISVLFLACCQYCCLDAAVLRCSLPKPLQATGQHHHTQPSHSFATRGERPQFALVSSSASISSCRSVSSSHPARLLRRFEREAGEVAAVTLLVCFFELSSAPFHLSHADPAGALCLHAA